MIGSYGKTAGTKNKYIKIESKYEGKTYTFFYDDCHFKGLMLGNEHVYYTGDLHGTHPLKSWAKKWKHKTHMKEYLDVVLEDTPWSVYVPPGSGKIYIVFNSKKEDTPNTFFYPEKDMRKLLDEADDVADDVLIDNMKQLILSWNPHFDVRGIRHRPLVVGTIEQEATKGETVLTHATVKTLKGSDPHCSNCKSTGWFIGSSVGTEPCQSCQTVLFTAYKAGKLCTATADAGTPCLAYKQKGKDLCYQHGKKVLEIEIEMDSVPSKGVCLCAICTEHANHTSITGQEAGTCVGCDAENVIVSPWAMGLMCLVCIFKKIPGIGGHDPPPEDVMELIVGLDGHPQKPKLTTLVKNNLKVVENSNCQCANCQTYAKWAGPNGDWNTLLFECERCAQHMATYHFEEVGSRLCSQCAIDEGVWDGKIA